MIDHRSGRAVVRTRGDQLVAEPADAATVVRALAEWREAGSAHRPT